jgi:hypothetical protein
LITNLVQCFCHRIFTSWPIIFELEKMLSSFPFGAACLMVGRAGARDSPTSPQT